MSLKDGIKKIALDIAGELREKSDVFTISKTIAERKFLLSTRKLVYSARISIDEKDKALVFSESLKETGFGWPAGGETDISPGFGFKAESYKTGMGPREGVIEEQSSLFGKKYNYHFDFAKFRGMFENLATQSGYAFRYNIFNKDSCEPGLG